MNNKCVVYTALFGDYDFLIDPIDDFEDCDFICFTNQRDLKSNIWKIIIVDDIELTNNLINRKYKMLPHKYLSKYQFSLYLDTNIYLKGNPNLLIKKYLKHSDLIMPRHIWRTCVYEEAFQCIKVGKSSYLKTSKQMKKYKKCGFPRNYGLSENNIILRRHNDPLLIKLMEEWWEEINKETQRDQLSFAFLLWKNSRAFTYMDESSRVSNGYFEWFCHKQNNRITLLEKIKEKFYLRRMRRICSWLYSLKYTDKSDRP